jgi:hypothetical protein
MARLSLECMKSGQFKKVNEFKELNISKDCQNEEKVKLAKSGDIQFLCITDPL